MNKVRVNITNAVINAPTYAGVTFSPSMINFFYGKNGTGKSTLAKAFTDGSAALTWKGDPYPSERILIYNEDFIEKNVRSYGNIPGVFTISEVNAEKKKLAGAEQTAAPVQSEPAAPAVQTSSDDDEIAAVIAAAIAAYQAEGGISSAESGGYYVRSIRRRTNNKWNRN